MSQAATPRARPLDARQDGGSQHPHLFSTRTAQPRVRRATDVVVLVPALLALALLTGAEPPSTFERALIDFLASFPDWLDPVWGLLLGAYAAWIVFLVIAGLVRGRFRGRARGDRSRPAGHPHRGRRGARGAG